MRLMWLVFVFDLVLNAATVALLASTSPMTWYWQLAVGLPVGIINGLSIYWLCNGGKWKLS